MTLIALATLLVVTACTCGKERTSAQTEAASIPTSQVEKTIKHLKDSLGRGHDLRIERGVAQVAALWRPGDGSVEDFDRFCRERFIADDATLSSLYDTLERNFEILNGYFYKIDSKLKFPLHVVGDPLTEVDMMFGSYDAGAHLDEDLYANKIAFVTALNFPFYTLEEKTRLGAEWSRRDWAYARMGDRFISRVPADVRQNLSRILTESDTYVADYNIVMGNLTDAEGKKYFPDGMRLISHWGLRDEIKSNYALGEEGLVKQRMIYQIMKRIIDQTIPEKVINSETLLWDPYTNKVYDADRNEVVSEREQDRRYRFLLDNFHASRSIDPYSPHYPTQIDRAIDAAMEIPLQEVESLFHGLLSSPQVKEVAAFISERLGRPLEPHDIWYTGFMPRSGMDEQKLDAITSQRYPTAAALKADLPNILVKLGWDPTEANRICSLIEVDASRGAGHAMGAMMRGDAARLRTRVGANGMDYKGYNIAVHEFGHNVEQTISMNDVDYYMLNGIPNTGFTEALAFLFQHKDLALLGLQNTTPEDMHLMALDNFWSCYEIMGVSLVDIKTWQWMYAHPEATPEEVREAVIAIAKEVWNTYYAGILGGEDETLLGIYSHMIVYPLYLPNYSVGHLISFQIEQYMVGRHLAGEVKRMFTIGRVLPNHWMNTAVGAPVSTEPTLKATDEALKALRKNG